MREAARNTLRSQLHNHRRWEERVLVPANRMDLPCACDHLRTLLHRNHPTIDGHYILTLDHIQLPPHLRIFFEANMNGAFYFLPYQSQILPHLPNSLSEMAPRSGINSATHFSTSNNGKYIPAISSNDHVSPPDLFDNFRRRSGPTSRGPRASAAPYFQPSAVLPRRPQHLARAGALQTHATHHPTQHQRRPPRRNPHDPSIGVCVCLCACACASLHVSPPVFRLFGFCALSFVCRCFLVSPQLRMLPFLAQLQKPCSRLA